MNQHTPDLQNQFLQQLCDQRTAVSVYLVSGIRLAGHIAAYDHHVIEMSSGHGPNQIVYKHGISTVLPQEARAAAPAPAPSISLVKRKVTLRQE